MKTTSMKDWNNFFALNTVSRKWISASKRSPRVCQVFLASFTGFKIIQDDPGLNPCVMHLRVKCVHQYQSATIANSYVKALKISSEVICRRIYRISSHKRPSVYFFKMFRPPVFKRDPAFIRGPALIISSSISIKNSPIFKAEMAGIGNFKRQYQRSLLFFPKLTLQA